MTEETVEKFIDRLAVSSPKDISREDLLRYLTEPGLGLGITVSVKKALKLFVESRA